MEAKEAENKNLNEVLDLFDEEKSSVKTSLGEVTINKIKVRQTPLIVKLIEESRKHFKNQKKATQQDVVMYLVSSKFDELIPLVSSFTSITKEQFEDMDLDDAAIVVASIIRKNKSFLEQKLLPLIEGLAKVLE